MFLEKEKASVAEGKFNRLHSKAAGWIVEERTRRGVRVASWVIKEQKTSLYCSPMGILMSKSNGLKQAESRLENCRGKSLAIFKCWKIRWSGCSFPHKERQKKCFWRQQIQKGPSPFSLLERWMEVLGPP